MKVIFLDNDGVICLANNWGGRFKKQQKAGLVRNDRDLPVEFRFDDFDKKAITILNEILEETDAEIVVSSDWRKFATVEELGAYYKSQGILKAPIDGTKFLQDCDQPTDFPWVRTFDLEQSRSLEILQWLKDHPEVTHWVAVDDLNMGKKVNTYHGEEERDWGLTNFVWTPQSSEGIKQSGILEKILKFLK